MGFTMDDSNISTIHVPSGPTSFANERPDYEGFSFQQLVTTKDNLEAELKALGSVLDRYGVTMQSSLTTFDGFPRSDIDVAQVRVTRTRIIHLRNDWKDLMKKIEEELHEHHADVQAEQERIAIPIPENTSTPQPVTGPTPVVPETPFAKVNSVESGSPAHEAGLKAQDLIKRFGNATWSNHERLQKVGQEVQQNLGKPLIVRVQRGIGHDAQELELRLTPRQNWGGRGSLGCHILPI